MRFRNADVHTRVWVHLQCDGHTLVLAPGEEVEMDLPEDWDDPYLQPMASGKKKSAAASTNPNTEQGEES